MLGSTVAMKGEGRWVEGAVDSSRRMRRGLVVHLSVSWTNVSVERYQGRGGMHSIEAWVST